MKGDKMKKLYLVCLLFILGLVSFAETYTKTEQREIIKQFGMFQSALKGKKFDKTAEVIYFPLSYEFEDAETASENKSEFFKSLKDLTLPKVDTKTNKISKYSKKGNSKTCDFEVTNKFVSSDDSEFLENYGVNTDKYFVVTASYFTTSDDTDLIDGCAGYNTYFFQLENKELKLVKKVELP